MKFISSVVCVFAFVLVISSRVFALTIPTYSGYVNDFANILTPETQSELTATLSGFEKQTTNELVVVTVGDLQGTSIDDYAARLFESWKIGKKSKDNGVLLLVAPAEREVRIEVGYGLEPVINDAKAGRIIRDIIIPEFKKGDYGSGIVLGTNAIMQTLSNQPIDYPTSTPQNRSNGGFEFFSTPLLFFGLGLIQYFIAYLARSKEAWPGGVIGIVLTIIVGSIMALPYIIIGLCAIGFGVLGFLLDYFLSKNYHERKAQGLSTNWFTSGGGFFGRGGGSSGGGFGGFGGGRSGGGGSSGRW